MKKIIIFLFVFALTANADEIQKYRISAIIVFDSLKAMQIKEKLNNNESFEDLAKKYSQGPGKDVGGDLGYMELDDLQKNLQEELEKLELNQTSKVLKTEQGFFILKKTESKIFEEGIPGVSNYIVIVLPILIILAFIIYPLIWKKNYIKGIKPVPELPKYDSARGWLLFFIITLIFINPTILYFSYYYYYKSIMSFVKLHPNLYELYIIYFFVDLSLVVFGIIAGILLFRLKNYAVQYTKIYLFVYLVATFISIYSIEFFNIQDSIKKLFIEDNQYIITKVGVYFLIWMTYLTSSKRVKRTYGS